MFLVFLALFRFVIIPRIVKQTDEEDIMTKDYAVEIDNLPRKFDGMEVKDSSGRTAYEAELSQLICERVEFMRKKEGKRSGAKSDTTEVKVEEMVLVRDLGGKLEEI